MTRSFSFGVLAVLAVLAGSLTPAACFSAGSIVVSEPAPGDASVDGAADGTVDGMPESALGEAEASPSPEGASEASAREGDAGDASDAMVGDAGVGPVTVTVKTSSGGEQGVTVVFADATGAMLATSTTDASGKAVQTVPSGGVVTALLGSPLTGAANLVTFVGVESGDSLVVLDRTAALPPQRWQITALPSGSAPGGTPNFFEVYGPCATNSFPSTAALPQVGQCSWAGPFPTLIVATSNGPGGLQNLGGFVFDKAIFDADGGTSSVAFGGPWTATTSVTVSVKNASGGAPTVNRYDYADGYGFSLPPTRSTLDPDAGTESLTFQAFPGLPDFVQTEIVSDTGIIAQRSDTIPATVSLDLARELPPIVSAGIDAIASPDRPAVAWTPATQAAFGDGTYVYVHNGPWSWTFVVPPGATSVRAPELPQVDGGAWSPSPTFQASNLMVATVEADTVSGYAALRALGTALLPADGPTSPPLPAAGTYVASVLTQ